MLWLAGLAVGMTTPVILSDMPTPTLVIDVDAIANDRSLERLVTASLDADFEKEVGPAAYLHARVASSLQQRPRYHRDSSYALTRLDTALPAGGAFLSMGLNNDYDASYYWARHVGQNARRAAPGIGVRADDLGLAEIFRLSEDEGRLQGNLQPNDGKWSEWCEFLKLGDQVDLVPSSALAALRAAGGSVCAISRADRPLGAEPEVVGRWTRAGLELEAR